MTTANMITVVFEIPPLSSSSFLLEPPFVETVLVDTANPPTLPLLRAFCKPFCCEMAADDPGAFVVLMIALTMIDPYVMLMMMT